MKKKLVKIKLVNWKGGGYPRQNIGEIQGEKWDRVFMKRRLD